VPPLSVVIPVRGRHHVLKRVLEGLDRQDAGRASFEVVVVADAHDEDPREVEALLATRGSAARALVAARPGASAARNLGWRRARGRIVLFLGADMLPSRRLVSEHLEWHRRHPEDEVGVLGRVRWARGLSVTPFMRWLDMGFQFDYGSIEGTRAAPGHFYAANVSVKRALLERVAGFDEELPFLYEDIDLAHRMAEHGLRLLYDRAAVAEHHHEVTLESWKERASELARAERRFVAKHPELEPFYFHRFTWATRRPPARGRGLRLARMVPSWVPLVGPYVWNSVDAYYRQELARAFLPAWEAAAGDERAAGQARAVGDGNSGDD
jgi:GT2 family glycosyltransferase